MNYKLLINIFTIFNYVSWVALVLVLDMELHFFFKLGIVMACISIPYSIKAMRELEIYSEKNKNHRK